MESVVNTIHRIVRYASFVGMGFLLLMMLLTAADIVGRGVFNNPIRGTYELTQYMLAVIVLLGIGYVQQTDHLIRVTVFAAKLHPRAQFFISAIFNVVAIVFFALVVWQGFTESLGSLRLKKASDILHIPAYPFELLIPVGALLIAVEFLITLIYRIRDYKKGIFVKETAAKEVFD